MDPCNIEQPPNHINKNKMADNQVSYLSNYQVLLLSQHRFGSSHTPVSVAVDGPHCTHRPPSPAVPVDAIHWPYTAC